MPTQVVAIMPQVQRVLVPPLKPKRVEVAQELVMMLTMARTLYGVDGSSRQREFDRIEEHAYHVALMTMSNFMKGDAFPEVIQSHTVSEPAPAQPGQPDRRYH
jgi:hypothetical protein